jgi:hypothetical protein
MQTDPWQVALVIPYVQPLNIDACYKGLRAQLAAAIRQLQGVKGVPVFMTTRSVNVSSPQVFREVVISYGLDTRWLLW